MKIKLEKESALKRNTELLASYIEMDCALGGQIGNKYVIIIYNHKGASAGDRAVF